MGRVGRALCTRHARHRRAARAFSGRDGRRARRCGKSQHRAAAQERRQHGHQAADGGHDRVSAGMGGGRAVQRRRRPWRAGRRRGLHHRRRDERASHAQVRALARGQPARAATAYAWRDRARDERAALRDHRARSRPARVRAPGRKTYDRPPDPAPRPHARRSLHSLQRCRRPENKRDRRRAELDRLGISAGNGVWGQQQRVDSLQAIFNRDAINHAKSKLIVIDNAFDSTFKVQHVEVVAPISSTRIGDLAAAFESFSVNPRVLGPSTAMPKSTEAEVLVVDGREISVTNPRKVLFPGPGYTKLDLVRYYLAVAVGALRAVAGRPSVLVRYPNGITGEFFFQKRAPESRPPWIEVVSLTFPSGRSAEEVVPRDAAALA